VEALVAKLLVLSHNLPRGTEEEYRMPQWDFLVSVQRLELRRFKMCNSNAKHSVIKVFRFVCGGKSFEVSYQVKQEMKYN
jgi:hypothetical protein